MKNKTLIISGVCIAALVYAPLASAACGPKKTSPSPAASPAAKADAATAASPAKASASTRPLPFRGTVSAVDQTAKTFSIAGKDATRVFMITEKTEITKDGKPATIIEIVDGVKVTGSHWKHDNGKLETKSVKIGAMDEKKAADTGKKEKAATSSPAATASPAASPKKP